MALVTFEKVADGIGKITLNDPNNLNAMGESMAKEFTAIVATLRDRSQGLRAIILTGAGRAFSAGGHLDMLDKKRQISGEKNRLLMLDFYESFLGILRLEVPLIAAINGHAVGAGLCLASACDVRVASSNAKFGVTFCKLGLHPGMGATYFLPRILGPARAAELMLTGRMITARDALDMGLISRLCEGDSVVSEATSVAQEIAECGPESVRQLLQSLRTPVVTLRDSLEREALCQSVNYASSEFQEGVKAAMEKRKPVFSSI